MSKTELKRYTDFLLPSSVVTKVDVSRLVRDAERVDGELTTGAVRKKTGSVDTVKPVLSEQLIEFLSMNNLSFETSKERTELIKQLRILKDKVPVTHMTFATVADPESLQSLIAWLRGSVHPQAVIEVGLQPALVAGVYLRTPNHVHDLSLRGTLQGKRGLLVKELEALHGNK